MNGSKSTRAALAFVAALAAAVAACGTQDPGMTNGGQGGSGSGGRGGRGGGGGGGAGGGTGGAMNDADAAPMTGDYFPFKVGNSWEYKVTEPARADEMKIHKIVRMEAIGGTGPHKDKMAFRVETHRMTGSGLADATISWQAREGSRIVRYREMNCNPGSLMLEADGSVKSCAFNEDSSWTPSRARLEERPMNGAYAKAVKWPETYMESKTTIDYRFVPPVMTTTPSTKTDDWEVMDVGATVMVEGRAFPGCVVLKKTAITDAAKTYTFCIGVGKVKEEAASGQVEALTKYTVL